MDSVRGWNRSAFPQTHLVKVVQHKRSSDVALAALPRAFREAVDATAFSDRGIFGSAAYA